MPSVASASWWSYWMEVCAKNRRCSNIRAGCPSGSARCGRTLYNCLPGLPGPPSGFLPLPQPGAVPARAQELHCKPALYRNHVVSWSFPLAAFHKPLTFLSYRWFAIVYRIFPADSIINSADRVYKNWAASLRPGHFRILREAAGPSGGRSPRCAGTSARPPEPSPWGAGQPDPPPGTLPARWGRS